MIDGVGRLAHAGHDVVGPDAVWAWGAGDVFTAAAVALPLAVVAFAVRRVRGRSARTNVLLLSAAAVVFIAALIGPIERLSGTLLTVHMLQHALLLSVGAPLIASAIPFRSVATLLPVRARRLARAAAGIGRRTPWWAGPAVALGASTIALWTWHAPPLYEAATANAGIHALEHATLVASGVVFWWVVLGGRPGRAGPAIGLLVLVLGTTQATALAAVLAFAGEPLYPAYGHGAGAWGLAPLEDQTFGAMVMWAIGGLAAAVAAAFLTVSWLDRAERRSPRPVEEGPAGRPPSGGLTGPGTSVDWHDHERDEDRAQETARPRTY